MELYRVGIEILQVGYELLASLKYGPLWIYSSEQAKNRKVGLATA